MVFDKLLTEPGLVQPRQKIPYIPPVESDLHNVVPRDQPGEMRAKKLIANGPAGSRWQIPLRMPEIIRRPTPCPFFPHPLRWQQKSGLHPPLAIAPPN